MLPVVQAAVGDPSSLSIVAIEITECQNGYARVGAVPDNSRCEPGGGGTCVDTEQVFLRADGENWTYLTSGTGISCTDPALEPDLARACEALSLRDAQTVRAEQVLMEYLADNPDVVVHSPTLHVGADMVALVGRNVDEGAAATVLDLTGSSASTIAQLTVPDQRFTDAFPVQIGDVTGDGEDDVLLPLEAASARIGIVASNENGRWHLVRADSGGGDTTDELVFARDPRFEDGRLVTTYNDCVPNCAEGTQRDVVWVYVRAEDLFRKAAS